MREILEFPKINENDISKVEELIDIIAENLDMDCSDELNELQKITGKNHEIFEFAEYWGWTDLSSLAKITLTPEPPVVSDLKREELEEIIEIILEAFVNDQEDRIRYYAELIHKSLGIVDVMRYTMSDDEPKVIADKILNDINIREFGMK